MNRHFNLAKSDSIREVNSVVDWQRGVTEASKVFGMVIGTHALIVIRHEQACTLVCFKVSITL